MDALEKQVYDELTAAGLVVSNVTFDSKTATWTIEHDDGRKVKLNSREVVGFKALMRGVAELPPVGVIQ